MTADQTITAFRQTLSNAVGGFVQIFGLCLFAVVAAKATGVVGVRLGWTELGVLALATIAAK